LQKENERLVKENNKLHMQIIQVKEEKETQELKWKQSLRSLKEECHDLKYLLQTRDTKIKRLEADIASLKSGMNLAVEKLNEAGFDCNY
jgi:predicted RNase H-like nuclease (RuvC/YqgF family)